MNPPDHPTPRTNAIAHRGYPEPAYIVEMTDLARILETELTIAENWVEHHSKHADDLIGENVRLRAEVERWQTVAAEMSQQREHNANEASRLRAEVEQLNLELEANKLKGGGCQCSDDEACAHVRRAEKAEAELAKRDSEYLRGTAMVAESASVWQSRAEKAEAERAALAKDKARLDWLEKNWIHWPITQNEETIRDAIDAAMKGPL